MPVQAGAVAHITNYSYKNTSWLILQRTISINNQNTKRMSVKKTEKDHSSWSVLCPIEDVIYVSIYDEMRW